MELINSLLFGVVIYLVIGLIFNVTLALISTGIKDYTQRPVDWFVLIPIWPFLLILAIYGGE